MSTLVFGCLLALGQCQARSISPTSTAVFSSLLLALGEGQAWTPATRAFARALRLAHGSDVRSLDMPPCKVWVGGSAFEQPPAEEESFQPAAHPEDFISPPAARKRPFVDGQVRLSRTDVAARERSFVDGQTRPPRTDAAARERSFVQVKILRTDAGTLQIEIPRAARGDVSSVVLGGAFSVAWLSAVGSFTTAALATASVGAVVFSLPFWMAGVTVAQQTVLTPLLSHELSLGVYAFSARWLLPGGRVWKEISGASEDLDEALPLLGEDGLVRALELRTRRGETWTFGQGLSPQELLSLAQVIQSHCADLESQAAQFEEI
ncbi:hypothetical protein T492DRAFT_1077328 [Pavlovales sp. CCMP2436]|nr:hypothetical protein T492DRAFT_1077328 [Pavlovales sp. CCMP2436]|mmetsp:Transcript_43184/g.106641  ORF Transcript_43184/g.106641 Transcript_43184/m.106641 type:complete len:321 (-) Transcript_43184:49-1011(-)